MQRRLSEPMLCSLEEGLARTPWWNQCYFQQEAEPSIMAKGRMRNMLMPIMQTQERVQRLKQTGELRAVEQGR